MSKPSSASKMASTRTRFLISSIAFAVTLFAGCSLMEQDSIDVSLPPEVIDVSNVPNAAPAALPLSEYGNPSSYVVAGKRYYTMPSSKGYKETGIASWYGTEAQGKRTSSGDVYDSYGMTAAHRTLPLPSFVTVTNKQNGRSVIVKVNDRGPFHNNRLIDLSYVAAVKLGIVGYGTGLVEISAIDPDDYNQEPGPVLREASNDLYLQAGAFQVRKNAERLRADIAAKGLGQTRIIEPSVLNDLHIVQVGPFENAAKAEQAAKALKPMGIIATIHHENDSTSTPMYEQTAKQSDTAKAGTSSIDTETAEVKKAPAAIATSRPEVIAMESSAADSGEATKTSKWKFWQWLPAMLKPSSKAPADATMESVATTAETTTETTADIVSAAPESLPGTDESEVVAMATDTAKTGTESGTSKWKFWHLRPETVEPETSMPAEATTNLVSATAESKSAPSEPEVMTMTTDAAVSSADTGTSKWKFWQWRPAHMKPTDTVTADVKSEPLPVKPEAIAMETAAPEAAPQAAPPAVPQAAPAARMNKTAPVAKMMPAPEADLQNTSSVYLETGAFRLRENAERLRPSVEALAPGAFQVIETSGTRTLYKIQIGPLRDKEEAMRVARELKTVGINPKIMDSQTGKSMMASTKKYLAEPVPAIEKSSAVIARPMTPDMAPVAPEPVTQAIATPYKRAPVPAEKEPAARMSAAEPVAPRVAVSSRRGKKTLYQQAGAFARPNNAVRLRTRIVDETQEPTGIFQESTDLADRGLMTLHKVQVGPLQNKAEAKRIKRALEPLGVHDSFPVYRQE